MLKKIVAAFILFSVGWLLVLPFLINWDDYQLQITKRIENVTGHRPDLTKGINVQFFPIPKVQVDDVVIKGLGEGTNAAFVEIGTLEARPSFLSLLAGKLQVDLTYLFIYQNIPLKRQKPCVLNVYYYTSQLL